MPLFVLTCLDKPDNLELRMKTRPAHQAHIAANREIVRLGGPFLDDKGEMVGSMLILETDDISGAQAFADNDPYLTEGVFASSEVRPFTLVVGSIGA
jgi:uncharacterized protein YciI